LAVSFLAAVTTLALLATSIAPRLEATHRRHGVRLPVQAGWARMLDGDTAVIRWSEADAETVRVLGIDTAELIPGRRNGPAARRSLDARGAEARGFGRGAFAASTRIQLLRSAFLDRYGRTLGYFFLNGRNYSVMVIEAGLSRETITRYGDNGLPAEAAEVKAAKRR
jgi:micrococcal nuclease